MAHSPSIINLADLVLSPGKHVDRTLQIEVAPIVLSGQTYQVVMAAQGVHVTVERVTGGFLVALDFAARVFGPCFRCLEEATLQVHPSQQEFVPLHPSEWDPADLSPFISNLIVDVDGLVREALILNLPTKILCSDVCPGVCPHCGQEAHAGPCGEDEAPLDPRWSKLRDVAPEGKDQSHA